MMKYLQKLGKALMLPVSCMPICGLLMGLGYWLCPAAMQGGEITGTTALIGYFLVRAGSALIDHIALLFAVGVGVGMSENNDGTGAVASLVSWLMITLLLNADTVKILIPSIAGNSSRLLAFSKIENPFIGILSGIIGSTCYNRFHKTRLPEWLSFFSGKRAVAIVAGVFSILTSFVLLLVWPLIFSGLTAAGYRIVQLGSVGAGIYAFLNRLLIPFGLHHALNNVFWFDTIGLGDLTHFWAGETSADVTWSLGMYMSGFFPCMMFGVPAAAWAIVRSEKPEKKKAVMGILLSTAICSFVCGVTEPFEFFFMFLAPVLYLAYAALYGIITFLTVISGFRAGFCFSGGVMDLIFSASLPAAAKTWLILPLGILSAAAFYLVFRFFIRKLDLKLLDQDTDESEAQSGKSAQAAPSGDKYEAMAQTILRGLGGAENLLSIDNCITRLRLEVKEIGNVDDGVIRSSGAAGTIHTGKNSLQVVIGTSVQFVADELKKLQQQAGQEKSDTAALPVKGKRIPMEEIPDPVFSGGIMGKCFGILPENGDIHAPVRGTVETVAAAGHAVSFKGEDGKEMLIHVGLDTVKLNGEGFQVFVREGEAVEPGTLVMKADLDLIRARGYNPMVIVVSIDPD